MDKISELKFVNNNVTVVFEDQDTVNLHLSEKDMFKLGNFLIESMHEKILSDAQASFRKIRDAIKEGTRFVVRWYDYSKYSYAEAEAVALGVPIANKYGLYVKFKSEENTPYDGEIYIESQDFRLL